MELLSMREMYTCFGKLFKNTQQIDMGLQRFHAVISEIRHKTKTFSFHRTKHGCLETEYTSFHVSYTWHLFGDTFRFDFICGWIVTPGILMNGTFFFSKGKSVVMMILSKPLQFRNNFAVDFRFSGLLFSFVPICASVIEVLRTVSNIKVVTSELITD